MRGEALSFPAVTIVFALVVVLIAATWRVYRVETGAGFALGGASAVAAAAAGALLAFAAWRLVDLIMWTPTAPSHWHPIANGYSRAEPPGFRALMDRLKTFPAPVSLDAMREVGIRYVVLHGAPAQLHSDAASATDRTRLVARFENDYLFEVTPAR